MYSQIPHCGDRKAPEGGCRSGGPKNVDIVLKALGVEGIVDADDGKHKHLVSTGVFCGTVNSMLSSRMMRLSWEGAGSIG